MSQPSVSQIHRDTNDRMYSRNVPSTPLQPYFRVAPLATKYMYMPTTIDAPPSSVPVVTAPTFDLRHTFNPGTAMAPWSGFASHVNDESVLRNQVFALQKGSQAVYVPSSHSDLYEYSVNPRATAYLPEHPYLGSNAWTPSPTHQPQHQYPKTHEQLFFHSTRVHVKDQ